MSPPSQSDRSEATRGALVAAGRALFGASGFGNISAEAIVATAGVTRGALHHHFGDKRGLFRAVFEELEVEIAEELGTLVHQGSPGLMRGVLSAFLDICQRPEIVLIALTDAPAVLGWKKWREIESRHGLGLLTALLRQAHPAEDDTSTVILAQLILGSVIEGALLVAGADDPQATREKVESSLEAAFGFLLP